MPVSMVITPVMPFMIPFNSSGTSTPMDSRPLKMLLMPLEMELSVCVACDKSLAISFGVFMAGCCCCDGRLDSPLPTLI